MKKAIKTLGVLSACILALCALAGCNKNSTSVDLGKKDAVLRFKVSSYELSTKADNRDPERYTGKEGILYSLDVFVFNPEMGNSIETYSRIVVGSSQVAGNDMVGTISATPGTKNIGFIANYPEEEAHKIKTLDDFNSRPLVFSHNSRQSMVMSGLVENQTLVRSTDPVYPADDNDLVTVLLYRDIAKLHIREITNMMPQYDGEVVLKGVYLRYVSKEWDPTTSSSVGFWHGDGTFTTDESAVKDMIKVDIEDTPLPYNTQVALPYSDEFDRTVLYAARNSSPESVDATEDNVTKLVIEVTIEGTTYYYPIGIPDIKTNTVYRINEIKLNKVGSATPNEYITRACFDIEADATPWYIDYIESSYMEYDPTTKEVLF